LSREINLFLVRVFPRRANWDNLTFYFYSFPDLLFTAGIFQKQVPVLFYDWRTRLFHSAGSPKIQSPKKFRNIQNR